MSKVDDSKSEDLKPAIIEVVEHDPEITNILKGVPKKQREVLYEKVKDVVVKMYAGPTPPPEMLIEYEKLNPGYAKKLLDQHLELSRKQTEHRHALESADVKAQIAQSAMGMWFGLIYAISVLIVGGFIAYFVHPGAGATIITVCLVGGVTIFVTRKLSKP